MIEILDLTADEKIEFAGMKEDHHYWVKCHNPTNADIAMLSSKLQIPEDDIRDALDEKEIPYIENEYEDGGYLKIVVRYPLMTLLPTFEKTSQITIPVVIFLFSNILVTVQEHEYVLGLRKKSSIKYKGTSTAGIVFLKFLENVVYRFEETVNFIDEKITNLQSHVFETISNTSLKSVFHLTRLSIYLDSAIKGDLTVFERLLRLLQIPFLETIEDYLEDLSIDLKQQSELIDIYRNLVENTSDAFASVINNNQNAILKILTVISLVISIPATISSIYGMNVLLPYQRNVFIFWWLMGLSVILSVISWIWMQKYDFN